MMARISFRANRSVLKTAVAVPTKYVLVGAVAFCGLVAVGSALSLREATKNNGKKEAARSLATGLMAGAGGYFLAKFLKTLIVERNKAC
jgi:hypothetical protein